MLGALPTSLEVGGRTYKIRTDYRDVLRIMSAFNDDTLTNRDKLYVCLKQLYIDLESIPRGDIEAAYNAAVSFIDCWGQDVKPGPKIVNWDKDEQLIFPAVNKAAGQEVRAVPYMHWWTFLGYFQSIDRDDTWGFILSIRQKRARHKKLEKHEQEFYAANRALCEVSTPRNRAADNDKALLEIYESLMKGGGDSGE